MFASQQGQRFNVYRDERKPPKQKHTTDGPNPLIEELTEVLQEALEEAPLVAEQGDANSDNGMREATERIGQEGLEADEGLVEAAWDPQCPEAPGGPSQVPKRLYGSSDGMSVHTEEGWRKVRLGSWCTTDDPSLDEVPEEWSPRAEELSYYGDITEAEDFGGMMYVTGLQRSVDRVELVFSLTGPNRFACPG